MSVCVNASLTVTTTENEPAAVGVPLMIPVVGSMLSPSGRPVAENVSGSTPPMALSCRSGTGRPTVLDCVPGAVSAGDEGGV